MYNTLKKGLLLNSFMIPMKKEFWKKKEQLNCHLNLNLEWPAIQMEEIYTRIQHQKQNQFSVCSLVWTLKCSKKKKKNVRL